MKNVHVAIAILIAAVAPAAGQRAPAGADQAAAVDAIFSRFSEPDAPGCTVGVSLDGRSILERAYGLADLEHNVALTPQSIIEGGSVSKQFTAAATILLAIEGKLSLDDDVRKYIPELPDYGETITIRHLLNHTSGLRDWGSVASIGGWPRTTRVHTHEHVLDILSRQRALNYRPGEFYSYTNSGYNLQAILVERVSGMSFAEFSRERVFEPLSLARTQWRDDYRRVVKDRAIAYDATRDGGFRQNMPFEQAHGNGGILTTVGDLLRFTRNLETGELGGPRFVDEMHRRAVLENGRTIAYASGLRVTEYRGVREINHSGSTAGYNAYVSRYPEQGVAVAVLCNVANAGAGGLAHAVADVYLGDALDAVPDTTEDNAGLLDMPRAERLGMYRSDRNYTALAVTLDGGALRAGSGAPLMLLSETRFRRGNRTVEFDSAPRSGGRPGFLMIQDGDTMRYTPVDDFEPGPAELAEYAGTYQSDEAETTFSAAVEDGHLVLRRRGGSAIGLTPVYPDVFEGSNGTYRFVRNGAGRVSEMSAIQGRVWDLRFTRLR